MATAPLSGRKAQAARNDRLIVEAAVADSGDPWAAFETFVRRVVDADTHSITIALAGTFTPSATSSAPGSCGTGTSR